MEILFLLVGLIFIAIGVVIVFSEVQARRGTQPVRARVTGFSTGRATTERIPSFYSVAQYTGPDGREYCQIGQNDRECTLPWALCPRSGTARRILIVFERGHNAHGYVHSGTFWLICSANPLRTVPYFPF